jgi:hypothetical protein
VRLPRQRSGERRLAAPLVAVEVIDNTCRRFAQQGDRLPARVGDKGLQRCELRVGVEVFQQVAEVFTCLAHHRRGHHQAQRIEGDGGTVAVGVGDEPRLQHAVIVSRGHGVTQRVAGADNKQIVRIVVHHGTVVEGIGDLARQVEVLAGGAAFLRGAVGGVGDIRVRIEEDPARRDPPVAIHRDVATLVAPLALQQRGRIGQQVFLRMAGASALEDVGEQARSESELVAFPR